MNSIPCHSSGETQIVESSERESLRHPDEAWHLEQEHTALSLITPKVI